MCRGDRGIVAKTPVIVMEPVPARLARRIRVPAREDSVTVSAPEAMARDGRAQALIEPTPPRLRISRLVLLPATAPRSRWRARCVLAGAKDLTHRPPPYLAAPQMP